MPSSDPFYSIGHKHGICFEIIFLVNAVMHKGILNQHQLSDSFFDLLRRQPKDVNVAALNYLYSCSRRPVFDACKRLRAVQEWFLENAKISRILKGMQTIYSSVMKSYVEKSCPRETIYKRVKTILSDGFDLCGRKYSFLAFSSNQLRERSAWFFAECKNLKIHHIQTWMGKFTNRNVAKCSARMGQCFSSTYATVEVPSSKVNPNLGDMRGMDTIFLMELFQYSILENAAANGFQLETNAVDTDAAFDVLTTSCAEQGNAAAIMLSAGFNPQTEPHLRGMLTCIQAAQLCGLREKSRIFVPSGRWLMGCLDELGVLEQGQCLSKCLPHH
ncbi:hypothetical protein M0R45_011496 [Rubus argutus]